MIKKTLYVLAGLIVVVFLVGFIFFVPRDHVDLATFSDLGKKYDVEILRDKWGVPHVFGKTNADTAFGIAYAHAEDDFVTIQGTLLAARAMLATELGLKGAPNDYMVQLLNIWDPINEKYDKELSPETRAICQAYADGLNYYASLHPDQANEQLYPARGKDVAAGFVHKVPLFFDMDKTLKLIFSSEAPLETDVPVEKLEASLNRSQYALEGSNTFGISPKRTSDGSTYLAVNSHQPWEGPVSWYEAHLHSEEGWEAVGGLFPGTPMVLHGHNRNLGWAHTVNRPDLLDVYELEINPDNSEQYRFDGEWKDLEVREVTLNVRILGPFVIPVKKKVYRSVHGPVIVRPHGTYALRYAAMGKIRQVEQWYRMNRAKNMKEWIDAMKIRSIPCFNCGYADREGNIMYLYNALIPVRNEKYDWSKPVPGNTSETLWTEYIPFEKQPMVINPPSGFVINCNSSPYNTTIGSGNPDPSKYGKSMGIDTNMNNRAMRILKLLGSDNSITWDEFKQYKYDMRYESKSRMGVLVKRVLAMNDDENTMLAEAKEVLEKWDLNTDPDNLHAALPVMAFEPLLKHEPGIIPDTLLVDRIVNTAERLEKHHGAISVPWKKVHRLVRGEVDLGIGGGPHVLHAVASEPYGDAQLKGRKGDSYVLMVQWDSSGNVKSESIHQYGSATKDRGSPHYADQSPLFVKRQLKPVWLDKKNIREHLEEEYRPGEEMKDP